MAAAHCVSFIDCRAKYLFDRRYVIAGGSGLHLGTGFRFPNKGFLAAFAGLCRMWDACFRAVRQRYHESSRTVSATGLAGNPVSGEKRAEAGGVECIDNCAF